MNVCNHCNFKAIFVKDIKHHLKENHIMKRQLIKLLNDNKIERVYPLGKTIKKKTIKKLKLKQRNLSNVWGK